MSFPHAGENIAGRIVHYLAGLEKELLRNNISLPDLNKLSRASLQTLNLLKARYFGEPADMLQLFRLFENRRRQYPQFNHHILIIEFSHSENLIYRCAIRNNILRIILGYQLTDSLTDDLDFIAEHLFTTASHKKPTEAQERHFRELQFNLGKSSGETSIREKETQPGRCYNLEEIFKRLNRHYFKNEILRPHLYWSRRPNRRLLGSYQQKENKITINCLLDQEEIPEYVLEGIMYHEMLHIKMPVVLNRGRRVVHSPEFRKAEKTYEHADALDAWVERYSKKSDRKYRKLLKAFYGRR